MIRVQVESHETLSRIMSAEKPSKEFNPSHLRSVDGLRSAILYAHVDSETDEVNHDVLRQAFSKCGRVVGLASFRYNGSLHCLVQYPDCATADEGLRKLNGMCIYDDCCILRVYYSSIPNLVFEDDVSGYKTLVYHNSHVQLSGNAVDQLQVWNPNKDIISEQNRTKNASRKVGHYNTGYKPQTGFEQKTAKGSGQVVPSTSAKLPSPVSASGYDNSEQQGDHEIADIVKTTTPNSLSTNKDVATTNTDKISSPTSHRTSTLDRPTSLDITTFTLLLNSSDCSDIDIDSDVSSISNDLSVENLPSPVSFHGVEVTVGCEEVMQPSCSVAVQCSMENDELQQMAMLCGEQLDGVKKKSAEIAEMESRNEELLLENANLKKLLSEVQNEMRQLKEIITTTTAEHDPGIHKTIAQDDFQPVVTMRCNKAQQIDRQTQTDSPNASSSRGSHKRSSSTADQDPTYEPSRKKKKKRKKIKSSSLSSSPSSPVMESPERTSRYPLRKKRKEFVYKNLQWFLKSQEYIKNKLDTMKEAMKICSAHLHKLSSNIVPQFENMYENIIKLASPEQSVSEDELFYSITELSTAFPSLIADLNESLSLQLLGVSLKLLSVLKKMKCLANEMNKYSPPSKALAYGNINTGGASSVESSFSNSCRSFCSPPPLPSLDEAVEMLDDDQPLSHGAESVQCVSSLIVSISTKFLQRHGRNHLFNDMSDGSTTDETQHGTPNGDTTPGVHVDHLEQMEAVDSTDLLQTHIIPSNTAPVVDYGEDKERTEGAARTEQLQVTTPPEGNEAIVTEFIENQYHSRKHLFNDMSDGSTTDETQHGTPSGDITPAVDDRLDQMEAIDSTDLLQTHIILSNTAPVVDHEEEDKECTEGASNTEQLQVTTPPESDEPIVTEFIENQYHSRKHLFNDMSDGSTTDEIQHGTPSGNITPVIDHLEQMEAVDSTVLLQTHIAPSNTAPVVDHEEDKERTEGAASTEQLQVITPPESDEPIATELIESQYHGREHLFNDMSDGSTTDETQYGTPSGDTTPAVDHLEESNEQMEAVDSTELLQTDTTPAPVVDHEYKERTEEAARLEQLQVIPPPESDEPIDIEVVVNQYYVAKSMEAAGTTATDSIPDVYDNEGTSSPDASVESTVMPCDVIAANSSSVTSVMPVHSAAPPPYTSSAGFYSQPSIPIALLQQPYIPTPIINVTRSIDGVVVKWTLEQLDIHLASQVHSYSLSGFKGDNAPAPDFWYVIGEIKATKLPMACNLTGLQRGKVYRFAVKVIRRDGVRGRFSQSKVIRIY